MDPLRIILQLCTCDDPARLFDVFVGAFREMAPLRAALRVDTGEPGMLASIPEGCAASAELIQAAARVPRPEIFPIGSQLPQDAASYPASDALLIPLRNSAPPETLVLIVEEGALGEDVAVWEELTEGMERIRERGHRLSELERERQELRRRAEESEALHTLGLAANRTLDQDEVLALVARFTRTLLGAHYAMVHTREGEEVHLVASVGMRNGGSAAEREEGGKGFARRVIDAEKPLVVGGADGAAGEAFPLHAGEGMEAALGVPLALYGDTFGALVVGYRRAYEVSPADIRLATTLAGHAAVAISNANLHRRLAARAAELNEAYGQLHEATQAKERFFNAISHDLRTPVGAIKGYMELILEGMAGSLPEQAERYIGNSHRAAETMLALVNDILDFAKLESGKMELELREWPLGDLLEDALSVVRPQARAKELELEAPERGALPTVRTDRKRLRQVLVNLLSNAVKFTETGSVTVRVESGGGPEDALVIRVVDTGPGIPEADQDRIFEEFGQVAGSAGTGLGLPISRKLVELMGGELRAESEPGRGSTFVITLPGAVPTSDDPGGEPSREERPVRNVQPALND